MVQNTVETITSSQNSQYKLWSRFVQDPAHEDCPWFPVEGGKHLLDVARRNEPKLILMAGKGKHFSETREFATARKVFLSDRLFSKLSNVRSPQGVLAFFEKPRWGVEDLTNHVLYLDRIQDPGNLGALLRTAASTGLFSLVCSAGTVSCFNAKVVRASAGHLYDVPCLQSIELSELLRRGFKPWVASPKSGNSYFETAFKAPLVFVLGNEGSGVRQFPELGSEDAIRIPMRSGVESLNVAITGALLMYEIVRRMENT